MRLAFLLACVITAIAVPAAAQPDDDWKIKRDPFDKTVIARYKGILAANPHDAGALAKLLEMYRRYRTVDQLKEEYQKQLDRQPSDWATLVVLGRLYRSTGDDPRALELLDRAAQKKD